MDQINLQTIRCAPDIQQSSQLQLELLRGTASKPNVPFLSLNETMEKVRQMKRSYQNSEPIVPRKTIISMQHQAYQQQFLKHQEMQKQTQEQEFFPIATNPTIPQPKIIIHPPTSHQNGAQQFHLVQVQYPGQEAQLQLMPFQTKSNTTNSEHRRYNKNIDTVNVSHEFVSQNRETHQNIYPSYYYSANLSNMPLGKSLPCPPLTPLQGLTMPKKTQFHDQLSNVVQPSQNISLEEIDIKPEITDQSEPDPSEFLKSFLSDPDVPKEKSKRKRKLKSWEMLLDNDISEDDDSYDYVERKKQKRLSKDEKEEKRARKIDKMNQKLMEKLRPCRVHLKKLNISYDDMPVKIVNDKIVKIRMPRVKSVPTNYKKISNIGYIKYPKGIAYKCLSETCRFQSYDEEVFEKHLINHHAEDAVSEWIGYCCYCDDFITAKTLIDEFDHLIEFHLQTTKKTHCETKKKEKSDEELNAEAILAIKEVLDTFEEIVAEGVDDEASVDAPSVSSEEEIIVIKNKKSTELLENKTKPQKDKASKSKPEEPAKEPDTIAGRLTTKRRKTIDSREDQLPPRRSNRHSTNFLEDEANQQLPSVIVNSSNDGKIKMTIKNPTRLNTFVIDKHKKKKDKKEAKNTFIQDPLTPPESSSNCTDSDYSEPSNVDI